MKTTTRQTHSLDAHPSYKGGRTIVYGRYVHEFFPEHPLANQWGWVAQHRLVGEDIVGRPLVQHPDPKIRECVHHKDENPLNNHPDNLQVMTFSAHRAHHTRLRNEAEFLARKMQSAEVEKALAETSTIKLAAARLGTTHQTLRYRFPELVAPYARRKPTYPKKLSPTQLEIFREMAESALYGMDEVSEVLGFAAKTSQTICLRHGIKWVKQERSDKKKGLRKQANLEALKERAKQIAFESRTL